MITLTGKKISEGIAIGKLSFYKRDTKEIRRIYVKDVEKEVMRFQKARQKALQELRDLYDSASKEVGEANAAIFEMQQMILEDQEIIRQITNIIVEHKLNAEYAVKNAVEMYWQVRQKVIKVMYRDTKQILKMCRQGYFGFLQGHGKIRC